MKCNIAETVNLIIQLNFIKEQTLNKSKNSLLIPISSNYSNVKLVCFRNEYLQFASIIYSKTPLGNRLLYKTSLHLCLIIITLYTLV